MSKTWGDGASERNDLPNARSLGDVRTRPAIPLETSESAAAKRRPRAAVTIHEVARMAGVSIITVSRAINTPDLVSASTRKRVTEAIARAGYVPNLMAGGLRSSKSRLVAALVPTLSGQVFSEMVRSLTESLAAKGYQVMLGQMGYGDSREDELLRAIIGRRPDGIVITGIMHSAEGRRLLLMSGIPIVETWDYTPTPIDSLVGFSHESIGQEVCDYLVARGRRRLAIISADDRRAVQRQEGFLRSAARANLRKPRVKLVPAPATHASGRKGLSDVLAFDPNIDAVFCSSDTLAMGVLTEARARGIVVPESLAIVGFGDLEFAATLQPSLTTVRVNGALMGTTAAQFIIDRAEGRPVRDRVVDIGFTVVRRESA